MRWLAEPVFLLELILVALGLLIAAVQPAAGLRMLRPLDRIWRAVPEGSGAQILLIGAIALVARMIFLPWLGAPVPIIHDEQSLLLQAKMLLDGALARPPHEFWPHFESFHINVHPAYGSMYFPGRSFPLLLGYAIFGTPWAGVVIVSVALAMATVWALRAWVSPRLAFLGGLLVVLRYGIFSYWVNSYWGGAFSALGGALVVGALPRLIERPRWRDGLLLGVGVLVLMTSRPVEGAILCLGLGLVLLPRLWRARAEWRPTMLRGAVPLMLGVALGGGVILLHNKAMTGDARVAAYDLNRETYAIARAFIFQPLDGRMERYESKPAHFRFFYLDEAKNQIAIRENPLRGLFLIERGKVRIAYNFFIGFALTLPILTGIWACRRRPGILLATGIAMAGFFITDWFLPHYVAPALPMLMIVIAVGFGWLAAWRPRGRPAGPFLARWLPLAMTVPLALPALAVTTGKPGLKPNSWNEACCAIVRSTDRTDLIALLQSRPGRDLVLVDSNDQNPIHAELVYNEPDIDGADIVWAHSLGRDRDRRLIAALGDRRVWRVRWLTPERYSIRPVVTGR